MRAKIGVVFLIIGFFGATFTGCKKINLSRGFIYGNPTYRGGKPVRSKTMNFKMSFTGIGSIVGTRYNGEGGPQEDRYYTSEIFGCNYTGHITGEINKKTSYVDRLVGFQSSYNVASNESDVYAVSQRCAFLSKFFGATGWNVALNRIETLHFEAELPVDDVVCREFCESSLKADCADELENHTDSEIASGRFELVRAKLRDCISRGTEACESTCKNKGKLVAQSSYFYSPKSTETIEEQAKREADNESSSEFRAEGTKEGLLMYRVDFRFDLPQ